MGASLKNIVVAAAVLGAGLMGSAASGATITQLNGPEDLFSQFEGIDRFTQDFEDAVAFPNFGATDPVLNGVDLLDPNDSEVTLIDFANPVLAFEAGGFGDPASGVTTSGDQVGANFIQTGDPLIATFSSTVDVFEVGTFFGNDDVNVNITPNAIDQLDVVLRAFDSDGVQLGLVTVSLGGPGDPPLNDFVDTFIGLRSDTPIRRVELQYIGEEEFGQLLETVDDFFIGLRQVAPVPVPAALPMALGGFAILFALGRRRRSS